MAKEKKMKKDPTKEKAFKGKLPVEDTPRPGKLSGKKHSKGKERSVQSPEKKAPTKKQVKKLLKQFEENLPSEDVAFIDVGCGVYSIDASAMVITYTADPGNRTKPRPLTRDERRMLIEHARGKMETHSKGQ